MAEDKGSVVAVKKGYIDEMETKVASLERDVDDLERENEHLKYTADGFRTQCADMQTELDDERERNDFARMKGIEIAERIIMAKSGADCSQKVVDLTMREIAGYLENYADVHDAISYAVDSEEE